jgi:hypothetical protein
MRISVCEPRTTQNHVEIECVVRGLACSRAPHHEGCNSSLALREIPLTRLAAQATLSPKGRGIRAPISTKSNQMCSVFKRHRQFLSPPGRGWLAARETGEGFAIWQYKMLNLPQLNRNPTPCKP